MTTLSPYVRVFVVQFYPKLGPDYRLHMLVIDGVAVVFIYLQRVLAFWRVLSHEQPFIRFATIKQPFTRCIPNMSVTPRVPTKLVQISSSYHCRPFHLMS